MTVKNKLFIKISFITAILLIASVSLFNFIIDPYQQYRIPTLYKTFYGGNQRALNPGLARNHDYNSIIIGSSMTENFLISKSSELLKNPIKLSISGGSAYEIFLTLKSAFANNKHIDTVLIGFDIYAVSGDSTRLRHGAGSIPLYLYDQNIYNDIFYLANFDYLKDSIKILVSPYTSYKNDPRWNYENMYQWQHQHHDSFGKEKILEQLKDYKPIKIDTSNAYSFDTMQKSFEHNFLSIIKQYPDINFIFFYPPYSIIAYKRWEESGTLDDILKFKHYVFQKFSKFGNVKLYDFHSAFEINSNFDNYKDFTHYSQEINNWMIDQMVANNFLITKENIDTHLQNLRQQIQEYDLSNITKEK